jgi:FkbM family methyltransferase
MKNDLIFDVGMHSGVDTNFYLKKGFKVVSIEANPILVEAAKTKFEFAIAQRLLSIENVGIYNKDTVLNFYINECDEWSSFHEHLGTRQGTQFSILEIPCKTLKYFVGKYGMPYFIKIDVEGVDAMVVRDLAQMKERPKFISVEDGGLDTLIALYEAGVRKFKFINQLKIRQYTLPSSTLEGVNIQHCFGVASSGPFGADLPGEWLTPEEAFSYYLEKVRPPMQMPIDGWWDIHGWFD